MTAEEQATLLDIVRRYRDGTIIPQVGMAWIYGLVSNSALWVEASDIPDCHGPTWHDGSCKHSQSGPASAGINAAARSQARAISPAALEYTVKHYHVIAGLRGGYLPNSNDQYPTKASALDGARFVLDGYRDNGEKVRGSARAGFWIARESASLPGIYWDSVEISGPCFDACEEWG